jgi:uncharacterized membrane protein (DUF106 family)
MTLSSRLSGVPDALQVHLHPFLIPVVGTLVILASGLILTLFFRPSKSV